MMIISRRGWTATVRSVLGDIRVAEINPGPVDRKGVYFPWITCPFCGSGVYLQEAPPHEHASPSSIAHDGRCNNPCCPANPATPLDAARVARGEAIVREMEDAERRRNHEAAMRRIRDERSARQAAWDALRASVVEAGGCVGCAWHAFDRLGKRRVVRHRGPCPRAVTARNRA